MIVCSCVAACGKQEYAEEEAGVSFFVHGLFDAEMMQCYGGSMCLIHWYELKQVQGVEGLMFKVALNTDWSSFGSMLL